MTTEPPSEYRQGYQQALVDFTVLIQQSLHQNVDWIVEKGSIDNTCASNRDLRVFNEGLKHCERMAKEQARKKRHKWKSNDGK